MRTIKSISNIAYQSPEYFGGMVKALQASGVIGSCYWVVHKGEDGDKDHIHFVLLGGQKTYDTAGLEKLFGVEVKDGKAASVTKQWRVTKDLRDWLCYAVHDTTYLLRHGEVRSVSYSWDDVKCGEGDVDTLKVDIADAKRLIEQGGDRVYRALRVLASQGKTWHEVVLSGLIPVNCLGGAFTAWQHIAGENRTRKGGGESEATPNP